LFLFLCALLLAFASHMTLALSPRWSPLMVGIATSIATFALTALFLRWDRLPLKEAGARPTRRSGTRVIIGFACGLFLAAVHICLVLLAGHVRIVRSPGIGVAAVVLPFLTYVALACREELAFHGYALRRLEQSFSLWGAQIAIAFVFAAEHVLGGVTWVHALSGAAIGSLLFGMATLATRGLAVPIGMHAAWNFGQWIVGGKDSPGFWKQVVESGFEKRVDLTMSISYMLVFLSATAVFWILCRKTSCLSSPIPLPAE
jgi:hypothetical protein